MRQKAIDRFQELRRAAVSCLAAIAAILATVMPAQAKTISESIYQAIAGPWLLAAEDADAACVITLSGTLQSGHHGVSGAGRCSGDLAAVASATIWDLDAEGGLTFRNAQGKGLLRLAEDLDGQYYQPGVPKGSRVVLMAANEGSQRLIHVSDMTGEWEFQRPDGTPVCDVAFSGKLLASSSSFRGLNMAGTCDPALRKLSLVKWHIEGALLVLVGSETADLTLVPKADGTFVKSAKEGGKPLVLEKK